VRLRDSPGGRRNQVLNPLTFLSGAQRKQMETLKQVGKRIKATIEKYPDHVEVALKAEDEEAARFLSAFTEAICQSVGQSLHMFDITGEIIDHT